MLIQCDKIIVAGTYFRGAAVARYAFDGTLDNTFGSSGKFMTDSLKAWSVASQLDGKIVMSGELGLYPNVDFSVARYLSCLNSGIEETALENVLSVYPNPTSNTVTVTLTCEKTDILITDIFGQEVSRLTTTVQQETLDLSVYPSGAYFLTVRTETGTAAKRIVKQ